MLSSLIMLFPLCSLSAICTSVTFLEAVAQLYKRCIRRSKFSFSLNTSDISDQRFSE